MRKTFRYRLYPTREQSEALEGQLAEACRLYNAALQERRDAWDMAGISLNYYDQANQVKEIRAAGDLGLANYSACQDVLRRVHKAYAAFFRRVKAGKKAGFPRFKSRRRFDSYTFPTYGDGCKLRDGGKLHIQGVGVLKVKLHRPVSGQVKTVTLKREGGRWYVCFSVEVAIPGPLPRTGAVTGIDVGLESFAVLSDGTVIENPRHYRKAQAALRRAQRKVARRRKGSHRRRKAVRVLQRVHSHVRNQRSDFHHQVSRKLVNAYDLIAVEGLNLKGLASGVLAKSVNDAGWGGFFAKLTYKAEEAGRQLAKVKPNGTSQRCPCGATVPKTLGQRWHQCLACGMSVSRDHASALEILRLGLSLQVLTPTLVGVA
ncbi:MAG TPA: transposase [Dehalococcoidia bacterium]|jgi:putative transposase|nr:transposase [Dehalococcoidia bacterium]